MKRKGWKICPRSRRERIFYNQIARQTSNHVAIFHPRTHTKCNSFWLYFHPTPILFSYIHTFSFPPSSRQFFPIFPTEKKKTINSHSRNTRRIIPYFAPFAPNGAKWCCDLKFSTRCQLHGWESMRMENPREKIHAPIPLDIELSTTRRNLEFNPESWTQKTVFAFRKSHFGSKKRSKKKICG